MDTPVVGSISDPCSNMTSERTPLLEAPAFDSRAENRTYAFGGYTIFTCLICLGSAVCAVPNLEIYRYLICQEYYAGSNDLDLIRLIGKFTNGSSDTLCAADEISKRVATFTALSDTLISIPSMCMVLLYGRLADKYGRKITLMVTTMGIIVARAWSLLVLQNAGSFSINTLLVGSLIMGFTGASTSLRLAVFSIACDCFSTAGGKRLVAMSWLSAGLQIILTSGPAVGSFLLSRNLMYPLYFDLCTTICSLLLLFALPETHPNLVSSPKSVQPVLDQLDSTLSNDEGAVNAINPSLAQRLSNLCYTIKDFAARCISTLGIFGRGRNFVAMGIVSFFSSLGIQAAMIVIQMMNHEFKWSTAQIGYYYSLLGAAKITVLLVLLPALTTFMTKRMNSKRWDLLLIQGGLVFESLAALGFGTISTPKLLILPALFSALSAPAAISIKALTSTLVKSEETSTLFAAFSMLDALAEMIGNGGMAWIYSATLSSHAGVVCVVLAVMYAVSALGTLLIRKEDCIEYSPVEVEEQ